jgi:phosphatidylinositol alpha-1,6-mannosyltransferase
MIVGLFPELLAAGGVQSAGRHTAAILSEIAAEREARYRLLSLNDPIGEHEIYVGDSRFVFRGFNRSKQRFVVAALKLAFEQPRVTVAAHPNLVMIATAMKIASPGMRRIVMSHGIEVWKALPPLRRWALRRADRVLAPSTDTAKKLELVQGVSAEKIRRLPWGLDPDFMALATNPEALPLPPGFPEGRVLLTVGRWMANERYKGADNLIRALPPLLDLVPDLHLVAVGEGDDRPRLEGIAGELGISGKVHFLNWIPKNELAACYALCDIFALPSSGEGFGFVFLEAMAFEKPVVGGAHGGTPDLVQDGLNGFLVPHGDTERLTGALAKLLKQEDVRRGMGREGRALVLRQFRFENFRIRLKEIVAEMGPS